MNIRFIAAGLGLAALTTITVGVATQATADTAPTSWTVNEYNCAGDVQVTQADSLQDAVGKFGTRVKQDTRSGGILDVVIVKNGDTFYAGTGFVESNVC